MLWPGDLGHGSREMLVKNFPRLKTAQGSLDAAGKRADVIVLDRRLQVRRVFVDGVAVPVG